MRTSPTCTYDPPSLIPFAWVINYWLTFAYTHVLYLMIARNVGVLKLDIVTNKVETNATIEG
jgi:hypothetical protein